ncbi:hypothetical protein JX265_011254 [Neoarthrinium moseri]|uniref:Uncharacterized protein n=1 Tax=Neoarthrinium moseri TaxID=1658444 RepID=A0A9Q0AJQ4_9PEZI|nr:uncharacterized protein JN550_010560 [Neoarthrinium moseri]KAI1845851.1 hypothetical protein JX266_007938 [Neoarthrinium moseri]KAI1857519.1 hypothetical protein JX265_011254 [Neoarthrinium moseri]KAI1862095.1 hypothetical protein JN550_010560 [Neoarthrinium moseri]
MAQQRQRRQHRPQAAESSLLKLRKLPKCQATQDFRALGSPRGHDGMPVDLLSQSTKLFFFFFLRQQTFPNPSDLPAFRDWSDVGDPDPWAAGPRRPAKSAQERHGRSAAEPQGSQLNSGGGQSDVTASSH